MAINVSVQQNGRLLPDIILLTMVTVCVCVVFSYHLFWTSSSLDVPAGPHRRKVTQNFSSTFLLRSMPLFFSREGFSHSFPSSTVKSNFVY